mmetsp:Transcript_1776/g.4123  ORF Transcript_1776/g.4123 Transcript_1776/m.4123 type:complete len:272 (-) Transcript_1776:1430-2245(-)
MDHRLHLRVGHRLHRPIQPPQLRQVLVGRVRLDLHGAGAGLQRENPVHRLVNQVAHHLLLLETEHAQRFVKPRVLVLQFVDRGIRPLLRRDQVQAVGAVSVRVGEFLDPVVRLLQLLRAREPRLLVGGDLRPVVVDLLQERDGGGLVPLLQVFKPCLPLVVVHAAELLPRFRHGVAHELVNRVAQIDRGDVLVAVLVAVGQLEQLLDGIRNLPRDLALHARQAAGIQLTQLLGRRGALVRHGLQLGPRHDRAVGRAGGLQPGLVPRERKPL